MYRRTLLAAFFVALILGPGIKQLAQAATRLDVATIKRALHVTEKENQGFIERVVELLNQGKLSRKSVTVSFLKARQRTKNKFQYFKYAMISLATRENVSLTTPSESSEPRTTQPTWWQRFWAFLRRS